MVSPLVSRSEVEKSFASVTIGEPDVRFSVIAASWQITSRRRWMTWARIGS